MLFSCSEDEVVPIPYPFFLEQPALLPDDTCYTTSYRPVCQSQADFFGLDTLVEWSILGQCVWRHQIIDSVAVPNANFDVQFLYPYIQDSHGEDSALTVVFIPEDPQGYNSWNPDAYWSDSTYKVDTLIHTYSLHLGRSRRVWHRHSYGNSCEMARATTLSL